MFSALIKLFNTQSYHNSTIISAIKYYFHLKPFSRKYYFGFMKLIDPNKTYINRLKVQNFHIEENSSSSKKKNIRSNRTKIIPIKSKKWIFFLFNKILPLSLQVCVSYPTKFIKKKKKVLYFRSSIIPQN